MPHNEDITTTLRPAQVDFGACRLYIIEMKYRQRFLYSAATLFINYESTGCLCVCVLCMVGNCGWGAETFLAYKYFMRCIVFGFFFECRRRRPVHDISKSELGYILLNVFFSESEFHMCGGDMLCLVCIYMLLCGDVPGPVDCGVLWLRSSWRVKVRSRARDVTLCGPITLLLF